MIGDMKCICIMRTGYVKLQRFQKRRVSLFIEVKSCVTNTDLIAGPEGFGTEEPPKFGWSVYGLFESIPEARDAVQISNDNETRGFVYKLHPNLPGVVIWSRKGKGTVKVGRTLGILGCKTMAARKKGALKYAKYYEGGWAINRYNSNERFDFKRVSPFFFTEEEVKAELSRMREQENEVGRTMENSYEKDALVIGDDSTVFDDYTQGTNGTSEENDVPPQEFYEDFWDGVYEEMGALVKERNEKIEPEVGVG